MRIVRYALIIGLPFALGGCAEIISTTRLDQIRDSKYQATFASDRPANFVSNCMKEALRSYRDQDGKATYANIAFLDFEKEHEITLRSAHTYLQSGPEILFHIQNAQRTNGGTESKLWVHPLMLSNGGSEAYLGRVSNVLRPCLDSRPVMSAPVATKREIESHEATGNSSALGNTIGSNNTVTDVSLKKLEQLKALHDRGVITSDEFEQKKKQILDSF